MSVETNLTAALISKLRTALDGLVADYMASPAVFSHVPQDATAPYVVLHEIALDENDTDTETGYTGTVNIHSWSESRDIVELADIKQAIYDALHHAPLPVTGYGVTGIYQEFQATLRDPDGITRHGVQRYRIILEPIA